MYDPAIFGEKDNRALNNVKNTYSWHGEVALGDDVGGDADNVVVVVDLTRDRGESEVWQRRQLDVRQGEAVVPLIPSLGLELEL